MTKISDSSRKDPSTCPNHGFAHWGGLPCPLCERDDRPTMPGVREDGLAWSVSAIAFGLVVIGLAGALL